jgi:hypothetical protein
VVVFQLSNLQPFFLLYKTSQYVLLRQKKGFPIKITFLFEHTFLSHTSYMDRKTFENDCIGHMKKTRKESFCHSFFQCKVIFFAFAVTKLSPSKLITNFSFLFSLPLTFCLLVDSNNLIGRYDISSKGLTAYYLV